MSAPAAAGAVAEASRLTEAGLGRGGSRGLGAGGGPVDAAADWTWVARLDRDERAGRRDGVV